jgi:hypothetical protein
MEYLMTYGWAILIVAVVLGALFELGVFSSASLIGTSCVAASGFLCSKPVLSGSSLTLTLGQYTGTNWNTATFCIVPSGFAPPNSMGCPSSYPQYSAGAFLNGQSGTYIFSSTPSYSFPPFGNTFSGTVWAVYTVQSYSGTLTSQIGTIIAKNVGASSQSSSSALYVPITIGNGQSAATPSPFQQMIQFSPSSYAQYENSNLGNIRFYQGSTELYSWCESGCSSTASQATFWINLPSGIPANSVVTVNMVFEPTSTNYDGVYAGEAPQLSSTYAQYDNGASVFNFYDNFAGTSLNTNIWTQVGTGYSINNGFIFQTSGTATDNNYLQSISSFSLPIITEAYIYPTNGGWIGFSQIGTYSSGGVLAYYYPAQNGWELYRGSNQLHYTGNDAENTYYIMSEIMLPGGTALLNVNYVNLITSSSGYFSGTTGNLYIGDNTGTGTMYWIRTRAYPPNGVMPSVSFGSVS